MMNEPEILDLLSEYLDGRLDKPTRAAVEDGLLRFPAARRALEELRSTVNLLSALPRMAAPVGFADRAAGKARKQVVLGETGRANLAGAVRRTFWSPVMSMAAALVICCLAAVAVWQTQVRLAELERESEKRLAGGPANVRTPFQADPARGEDRSADPAAPAAADLEKHYEIGPLRQQQHVQDGDAVEVLQRRRALAANEQANRRKFAASAVPGGAGGGFGGAGAAPTDDKLNFIRPDAGGAVLAASAPALDTFAGNVVIKGKPKEIYEALVEALAKLEKRGSLKWSPPAEDLPVGQSPSFTLTTDDPAEIEAVLALLPRSPAVSHVELVPSPVLRDAVDARLKDLEKSLNADKGDAEKIADAAAKLRESTAGKELADRDRLARAEKDALEFDRRNADVRSEGKSVVAKADEGRKAVDPQGAAARDQGPRGRTGAPEKSEKAATVGAAKVAAPAESAKSVPEKIAGNLGAPKNPTTKSAAPKAAAPAAAPPAAKGEPTAARVQPGKAPFAEAERGLGANEPAKPGQNGKEAQTGRGASTPAPAAAWAAGGFAPRPGESVQQKDVRLQAAAVVAQLRVLHRAVDPAAGEKLKKLSDAKGYAVNALGEGGGHGKAGDGKAGEAAGRPAPDPKAAAPGLFKQGDAKQQTDADQRKSDKPADGAKDGKDAGVRRTITLVLTLQADGGK